MSPYWVTRPTLVVSTVPRVPILDRYAPPKKRMYRLNTVWKRKNRMPRMYCPLAKEPKPITRKDTRVFQSPVRKVSMMSLHSSPSFFTMPHSPRKSPFRPPHSRRGMLLKNASSL